jgi:predicted nucleic acid-binding protein
MRPAAAAIALDSNTLGLLVHPKADGEPEACRAWLAEIKRSGWQILVPEIADYELRRELIRINSQGALARLDFLKEQNRYLILTTNIMLRAAQLWAASRNRGVATTHPKSLDVDVILAAQVQLYSAFRPSPVVLATTNVRHLARFVDARPWQEIQP